MKKVIQSFLQLAASGESMAEISRLLGHKYNIYNRWLNGTKKFLWQDFVQLCKLKNWDLNEAIDDSHKIFLDENFSDKHVLSSIIAITSRKDKVYEILTEQKTYRILRGQRKLEFLEFLLLTESFSNNTKRFLSFFVDQNELSRVWDNHNINTALSSILTDKVSCIILQILKLDSYKKLPGHSNHFVAKQLNLSPKEVERYINRLLEIEVIRLNEHKRYELNNSVTDHLELDEQTSLKVHNMWREEIYRRSIDHDMKNGLRGVHLFYNSSRELDEKITTLTTRFYNDIKLLIQDYDSSIGSYSSTRVLSISAFKVVDVN